MWQSGWLCRFVDACVIAALGEKNIALLSLKFIKIRQLRIR